MADVLKYRRTGSNHIVDCGVSEIQANVRGHLSVVPKHGRGDEDVFGRVGDTGQEYGGIYD